MDLKNRTCKSCEGEEPFTLNQITEYMQQVDNWELVESGKAIEKEFIFSNFEEALGFVNSAGKISEEENHHPDILLYSYKKVRITLTTHSVEGLSENDFIVASKIDELIKPE